MLYFNLCFAATPFDVVKVRLQAQLKPHGNYNEFSLKFMSSHFIPLDNSAYTFFLRISRAKVTYQKIR